VAEETGARSCPNKLIYPLDLDLGTCCYVDVMGAAGRLFFFRHRGGGDGGYWKLLCFDLCSSKEQQKSLEFIN
jgi:hypothetical protein